VVFAVEFGEFVLQKITPVLVAVSHGARWLWTIVAGQ
jgi:hypothetical protein